MQRMQIKKKIKLLNICKTITKNLLHILSFLLFLSMILIKKTRKSKYNIINFGISVDKGTAYNFEKPEYVSSL